MLNVLFLCTGNSARSVLGEGLLNHIGQGEFKAYSAGSQPVGQVNPFALQQLKDENIHGEFSSKSWDIFSAAGAPKIDIVITVCDNAAAEICPKFKGNPQRIHWSLTDPATVQGSYKNKQQAFKNTYDEIEWRLKQLML